MGWLRQGNIGLECKSHRRCQVGGERWGMEFGLSGFHMKGTITDEFFTLGIGQPWEAVFSRSVRPQMWKQNKKACLTQWTRNHRHAERQSLLLGRMNLLWAKYRIRTWFQASLCHWKGMGPWQVTLSLWDFLSQHKNEGDWSLFWSLHPSQSNKSH